MGSPSDFLRAAGQFTFKRRPMALPADLRPDWQIAVLVLILAKCCKNGRSSLRRLHVLNWATRSARSQRLLLNRMTKTNHPDEIVVRLEPALNRAINLALARGLVERIGGNRIKLNQLGLLLSEAIDRSDDLLVQERTFLNIIGKKITEVSIDKLVKGEGIA